MHYKNEHILLASKHEKERAIYPNADQLSKNSLQIR